MIKYPAKIKDVEEVINHYLKSLQWDHKRDTSLINLLKSFELVYIKPSLDIPIISIVRNEFNNFIYDEFIDTSIVIINDLNKHIQKENSWRELFGNWDASPNKLIKRVLSYKDFGKFVVGMYGTNPDSNADLVVFIKKYDIIYPIFIYPYAKNYGLYSYPNIERMNESIIRIGYITKDMDDYYGSYLYFLINENECKVIKRESYNGTIDFDTDNNFEEVSIYGTYYNEDGTEKENYYDCFAKYADGTYKFKKTQNDSLKLYDFNLFNTNSTIRKYWVVYTKNKLIKIAGPKRDGMIPIEWDNTKYYVNIDELID